MAAPGEDGKTKILFRLRVGGPALLAGQSGGVLRVEISLYMLDAAGGVQTSELETVEVDLAALREAVERSGLDFLGSFELKPGSYTLRMLARNLETRKLGVRSAALQVPDPTTLQPQSLPTAPTVDARPTARSSGLGAFDPPFFPDDAEGAVRQAGPGAEGGETAPPRVPSLSETAEGRRIQKAARTDYRNALGLLVAGRVTDALAAVATFEDALLHRQEKPVRFEQIAELEFEVSRDLAAVEPESLISVMGLHLTLFKQSAAKRRYPGSTLTQEMVLRLAALCRERSPEMARQFERALGVELLRAGLRRHGEEVLQTVLAATPGDPIARLELAVNAERRGEHGQAIEHLEALLRDQPENREARLRLALDQAQVGRTRAAEEGLRKLIRDDTDKWGLHLAYQELARLSMANNLAEADEVLSAGLKRLPGDEKLLLLRAAVRERRGLSTDARDLLEGLKPEGEDGGGSARHRYNQSPENPYAAALADLNREAVERLPGLKTALEKTAK